MRLIPLLCVGCALLFSANNFAVDTGDALPGSGPETLDNSTTLPSKGADIFSGNGVLLEPEFLPVKEAYIVNAEFTPDGRLRLNWQIADSYYLYRHGFKVKLLQGKQAIETELDIPPGLEKEDEYFGLVQVYYHQADLFLDNIPAASGLRLIVTSQGCADAGLCYPPHSQHFLVDGERGLIGATSAKNNINATAPSSTPVPPGSDLAQLPYMLLLALMGGFILNLMPCVFPVLSLKVLAFANDREHSQTTHGWVYSAGVVTSFIIVAAILVSLQAAGEAIGWGFHLQSPWLVGLLAYLFFVMGLSLSGYIELGSQWMNAGQSLAHRQGYSGSFFTGVLATVVASPCTAPFMGAALGFAVTQPALIAISVFATLGFGMALPVLILSYSPALLNKIPKPGLWMDKLKQLLAFPLYATAVWLAWVVGNQAGVNAMAILLLGCVLLGMALWLWRGRLFSRSLAGLCLLLALASLASPWLTPASKENSVNHSGIQTYSAEALQSLRHQGKAVFLNITADWCITCLANEKVTLSTDTVQQAFQNAGITYMKGDWTNHDPAITALLKDYGRTGIPLYVIFPASSGQAGEILPQILTESIVLDAIAEATGSAQFGQR